jgi:RimJ/RimL family protein N-acetyltransferase
VTLRRLRVADLPAFQAYRHAPGVGRYQGWSPQADAEALAFIEQMAGMALFPPGAWLQLGIAERTTDGLIGDIGVHVAIDRTRAEIGFTLAPCAQGRGLGTEAVDTTVRLLFAHTTVTQVIGITDARNLPSIRLLERLGMRRVDVRQALFRGEPCVEHTYAIGREGPLHADLPPHGPPRRDAQTWT